MSRIAQYMLFSGQGSQYLRMGADLYHHNSRYQKHLSALNQIAIDLYHRNIIGELYDRGGASGDSSLKDLSLSHPALFIVQLALARTAIEQGFQPDALLGVSLGEWVALTVAEALDEKEALGIIFEQTKILPKYCAQGAMLALLSNLDFYERVKSHFSNTTLVAENTPGHLVISGDREELESLTRMAESEGGTGIFLPVEYGFHSPLIDPAEAPFRDFMERKSLKQPKYPVYSACKGGLVKQLEKRFLWQIAREPMYFREAISQLPDFGHAYYLDASPQGTLAGFLKKDRRLKEAQIFDVLSPFGGDSHKLEQALRSRPKPLTRKNLKSESETQSSSFLKAYSLDQPLMTGGMYKGIASPQLVSEIANSGMLGVLGSAGLTLDRTEQLIQETQKLTLRPWALNCVSQPGDQQKEEQLIDLCLRYGIQVIEASAYLKISAALVRFRTTGLYADGRTIHRKHRIIAKVSHPSVAKAFLSPPPGELVRQLLISGIISPAQALLARNVPMADDITIEADSGGHTSQELPTVLIPAMINLRDTIQRVHNYDEPVRIGSAGGIGTPQAGFASLALGASYLVTGSINQCTIEAATSYEAKRILCSLDIGDTGYAPAADQFELGGKVQVVKKGLLFANRANRLHSLFSNFSSLDQLPRSTQDQLQRQYFKRSFEEIWQDIRTYLTTRDDENPTNMDAKSKMALTFKWYFAWTTKLALTGSQESPQDYQIHCGPAMGAFNQWAASCGFQDIESRLVAQVNYRLIEETLSLR